jgi:poly-beta-1,6-N-acetyl-D-glucosamine synthase
MTGSLSYTLVTPTLNEYENLSRLFAAVRSQTVPPRRWVIVDTGSTDATRDFAEQLAAQHAWIRAVRIESTYARGGPVVAAFNRGLQEVEDGDLVVKLDADISIGPDYFQRLLATFETNPRLGIASGTCFELQEGTWRERYVTADHVWGACRAYRRECLSDVSPLEERMGWDGIDVLKANARGWHTGTIRELEFRHHRGEGSRDHGWAAAWLARGNAAYYMGYRPTFLVARALHHTVQDPRAVMMIIGWVQPLLLRKPRSNDEVARAYLRRQQRLRELPLRAREARGKRASAAAN